MAFYWTSQNIKVYLNCVYKSPQFCKQPQSGYLCVQIGALALDTVVENVRNISDEVLQAVQLDSPRDGAGLGECCRCVGEEGREGVGECWEGGGGGRG